MNTQWNRNYTEILDWICTLLAFGILRVSLCLAVVPNEGVLGLAMMLPLIYLDLFFLPVVIFRLMCCYTWSVCVNVSFVAYDNNNNTM